MALIVVGERLPGALERQRILEEAGLVLAEARRLMDCLDRSGGRLSPEANSVSRSRQVFYQHAGLATSRESCSGKVSRCVPARDD